VYVRGEEGVELLGSCRAGSCSSCAGEAAPSEWPLDGEEVDEGLCLECVTFATTDATLRAHCEDQL